METLKLFTGKVNLGDTLYIDIHGMPTLCRLVYQSANGYIQSFMLLEYGPRGWYAGDTFRRFN